MNVHADAREGSWAAPHEGTLTLGAGRRLYDLAGCSLARPDKEGARQAGLGLCRLPSRQAHK